MPPPHNRLPVKALVFDAYGTLFDVHSVMAKLEEFFPGQAEALSQLWRTKQLEYTWLVSLMGHYRDFWQVTREALIFACRSLAVPLEPAVLESLLEAYLHLSPYPEVGAALEGLAAFPRVILSNGSPRMLDEVLANSGLNGAFSRIISVDEVQIFKPSPRVYRLAAEMLNLAPKDVGFISSNAWDACGARAFGFWTCWLNRSAAPWEELGFSFDVTVKQLTKLAGMLD